MKDKSMIQLKLVNIEKSFKGPDGQVRAVSNVSLELNGGDMMMVFGPSGCGKTTLLLMAGGLLEPDLGSVVVAGEDVYGLNPERRNLARARNIGFVFQQFHLIPYLTVLQNILLPSVALSCPEPESRAKALVLEFNLGHRALHYPSQLSTGERQRVALARALFHNPGLILADEPTGNLDEENARQALDYLRKFARNGSSVLLVTHDKSAREYATSEFSMRQGKLDQ